MLEIQQYAAPASRFNRPAMPGGHLKVRAFYAIAASVAGMGGNGRHGAVSASAAQRSPGKRRRNPGAHDAAGLHRCRNLIPRVRCAYPGYGCALVAADCGLVGPQYAALLLNG